MEDAAASDAEEDLDEPFNLETFQVPLRDWVAQDQTRSEIRRRFVSCDCRAAAFQALVHVPVQIAPCTR